MNYFIYFVDGDTARQYLGGTNYVGVWADVQALADKTVRKHFAVDATIILTNKNQVQGEIGYLY